MTDTDRLAVWLREAMDAAEQAARKASELCGCHPPAPAWAFGDEATDGRIVVVDDPHPGVKRKIGRRWNGSYEGLFMAEHIVRHDPEAVLRRIAADRKTLDDCDDVLHDFTPSAMQQLARSTIRNLAEGYGWTEETV
ncbi:DUF6221 family protein [Streptomyces sp. NPDC094153]|uniref:DUF6221 family protein n=1 Tax=Streptomyces sp. NPDC094153 TaxID=3366058 RepID=UPI003800BB67